MSISSKVLKSVLSLSGIDTKVFFLFIHIEVLQYTYSACNKGVSLNDIFKPGDWTNADTFINHYSAHASNTPVGQIILNESPLEG